MQWQEQPTTIEFVEKKDEFNKDFILACSIGLNIGFLIGLLYV